MPSKASARPGTGREPARRRAIGTVEIAIALAGVVTIALLLFSTRVTTTTLDRSGTWTEALAELRLNVGLSHVWLEEAIAGDESIDVERQVYGNVDVASARCDLVRETVTGAVRPTIATLCEQLTAFRSLAVERWEQRARGRAGSAADQAYDAAFRETLRLADAAGEAIDATAAENRATLNGIHAGVAILLLVLFAGMVLLVHRRDRLAAINERLRELDRLKDTFIASISHELRTPLTSIIGFLMTLERHDLALDEDERRRLLTVARVQSERLARLVNDLLFFAQVELGSTKLTAGIVDLEEVARRSVSAAEPLAQKKGVALRTALAPVPPVRGDEDRLAQLLDNLVSNALKFTPPGGSVEVGARADGDCAILTVSDTGIGIPPAEQEHLFDRFFRATTAVEQAIPGTGLGLAIAKAIVDAHDGSIEVESGEGLGTTFRVALPLADPPDADTTRGPTRSSDRPLVPA